jgi:hypothetical protein
MELAEVGSVMARLAQYNEVVTASTIADVLFGIIAAESLVLLGGLQVSCGQLAINPSCCCGLEDWREWQEYLVSGESPWMGHDPTPRLELVGNIVKAWSDSESDAAKNAFAIEFEQEAFVAELERVQRELQGFLLRVRVWAEAVGFSDPIALCRRIDSFIGISGPFNSE